MIIHFLRDDTAATAVEYGLIVAAISLAVAAGVGAFSERMLDMFGNFSSVIDESQP